MIDLLIFLLMLGVLVVVHEFGHFIVAKRIGVRVEKFSVGFGRQLACKKREGTEYVIGMIPLGGYVKLAGDNLEEFKGGKDEYFTQAPGKRFWIIAAGPLLNYILGFLCFWAIFFIGYPTLTTKVGDVMDGYGAKEAGMQKGDRIIAVGDRSVSYWEDMQEVIQKKKSAEKVKISILRDGRKLNLDISIKEKTVNDLLGQKHNVGLLGILSGDELTTVKYGFFDSAIKSFNKTIDLTLLTLKALGLMLTGKLSMKESVTGPLGIFFITSKAAKLGIIAFMHLVATLSISLGIFNLLPLPILDGGHVMFLAIEKIRGKVLSVKAERVITQIGFSIIVSLAVLVTVNDIIRLFGGKFSQMFK